MKWSLVCLKPKTNRNQREKPKGKPKGKRRSSWQSMKTLQKPKIEEEHNRKRTPKKSRYIEMWGQSPPKKKNHRKRQPRCLQVCGENKKKAKKWGQKRKKSGTRTYLVIEQIG
jgi:hypothetical protein